MQDGKNNGQDISKTILVFTLATTLILGAISFIPPRKVGGLQLKRANLLSDMVSFDDVVFTESKTSKDILDTSFLADIKDLDSMNEKIDSLNMAARPVAQSEPEERESSTEANAPEEQPSAETATEPTVEREEIASERAPMTLPVPNMADIEDFSREGEMMRRFYEALSKESQHRTVRIAVLGDSFIESDIVTSDLRNNLQERYGGDGVGFIPFADPLAKYRPTLGQTYENWDSYSVMRKKSTPQHLTQDFFISGLLAVPREGAVARFENKSYKSRTASARSARLIFKSRGRAEIKVVVNDTDTSVHPIEASEEVQHLDVKAADGGKINTLSVSIEEGEKFVGYGVVFEQERGVSVHNFGVRSNSGLAIFSTDRGVNSQIDRLMNYDLVVLEYGLNVMNKEVTDYTYYGNQLRRLIGYVRECFPKAAILVMSVGDVGVRNNGEVTTSPAVAPMIAEQRAAAYEQGVAFWNLYNAMGGEHSMQNFVAQGWAAKDYTHINHKGGSVIAGKLADSFESGMEQMRRRVQAELAPIGTTEEGAIKVGTDAEMEDDALSMVPESEPEIGVEPELETEIETGPTEEPVTESTESVAEPEQQPLMDQSHENEYDARNENESH